MPKLKWTATLVAEVPTDAYEEGDDPIEVEDLQKEENMIDAIANGDAEVKVEYVEEGEEPDDHAG